MAGLTADECIYLPEDVTYRPKPKTVKHKSSQNLSTSAGSGGGFGTSPRRSIDKYTTAPFRPLATEIRRCSRCIRTGRACSFERPCEPCREHGLSAYECLYTSASHYKVRGPGAKKARADGSASATASPAVGSLDSTLDAEQLGAQVKFEKKQIRSVSMNSALEGRRVASALTMEIPPNYRTPSPPTFSPISDPGEWGGELDLLPTDDESEDKGKAPMPKPVRNVDTKAATPAAANPADNEFLRPPVTFSERNAKRLSFASDLDSITGMSRGNSAIGTNAAEYPNLMHMLHGGVAAQHLPSAVPESSPQVFTEDYISSPSPFNSPQFASSPPLQQQKLSNRSGSFGGSDPALFPTGSPQLRGQSIPGSQRMHSAAAAANAFGASPFSQSFGSDYSHSPPNPAYGYSRSPSNHPVQRHRVAPSPQSRHSPVPYHIPVRGGAQGQSGGNSGQLSSSPLGTNAPGIPIRSSQQQVQHRYQQQLGPGPQATQIGLSPHRAQQQFSVSPSSAQSHDGSLHRFAQQQGFHVGQGAGHPGGNGGGPHGSPMFRQGSSGLSRSFRPEDSPSSNDNSGNNQSSRPSSRASTRPELDQDATLLQQQQILHQQQQLQLQQQQRYRQQQAVAAMEQQQFQRQLALQQQMQTQFQVQQQQSQQRQQQVGRAAGGPGSRGGGGGGGSSTPRRGKSGPKTQAFAVYDSTNMAMGAGPDDGRTTTTSSSTGSTSTSTAAASAVASSAAAAAGAGAAKYNTPGGPNHRGHAQPPVRQSTGDLLVDEFAFDEDQMELYPPS